MKLHLTLAVLIAVDFSIFVVSCPLGKYDSAYGCEPCPKGTYKIDTGPGPCTRCPGRLMTNQTGSTSSDDCYQPCPEGQYIDILSECQPCPKNTYRTESMDTCATCGDGLVTTRIGATSISECVPCKRGTYRHWLFCTNCPNDPTVACCKKTAEEDFVSENTCEHDCPIPNLNCKWSDSCQPCPLNTYKEEGEIDCRPCPDGTVIMMVGAYDISECIRTTAHQDDTDNMENNISNMIVILSISTVILCVTVVIFARLRRKEKCLHKCYTPMRPVNTRQSKNTSGEQKV